MSDLDLTATIAAVRQDWPGAHFTRDGSIFTAPPVRDGGATAALIDFAVAAAAPLIEAQVRERVAQEIEDALPDDIDPRSRDFAARIARGSAS